MPVRAKNLYIISYRVANNKVFLIAISKFRISAYMLYLVVININIMAAK